MSTSAYKENSFMVLENRNIHLEITSKSGRSIAFCSARPFEDEVLFVPGRPFIVTGRTTDSQGRTLISMKEK